MPAFPLRPFVRPRMWLATLIILVGIHAGGHCWAQTTPTVTTFNNAPATPVVLRPGMTRNQQAVANYLTALSTTNLEIVPVINALNIATDQEYLRALRQLSGESLGMQVTTTLQNSQRFVVSFNDYLRNIGPMGGFGNSRPPTPGVAKASPKETESSGGPVTDALQVELPALAEGARPVGKVECAVANPASIFCTPTAGFVARGYGASGRVFSDFVSSGYTYDNAGTTLALQTWFDEDCLVGLVGNYGHSNIHEDFGSSVIDSVHVGAYGKFYCGSVYMQGLVAYGNDSYDSTRQIFFNQFAAVAQGNRDGHELVSYLEVGVELNPGGFTLRPFAGFQYILLHLESFQETGAGLFNLRVSETELDSCRSNLGFNVAWPCNFDHFVLTPQAYASWMHEFSDDRAFVSPSFAGIVGPTFTVQSPRLGRDYLVAGGSLNLNVGNHLILFAAYDYQGTTQNLSHTGSGGFEIRW